MKNIITFSDYLNEKKSINEEYRVPNDSTESDVAKAVSEFDFKEADEYINSDEFKSYYDDSEIENIMLGKFGIIPTTNIDKQTATYQILHYIKNKDIKIDDFKNIVKYAIKLDDLFYGSLLIRGTTFYNPELKKSTIIEDVLKDWVKYYNL